MTEEMEGGKEARKGMVNRGEWYKKGWRKKKCRDRMKKS
jgi:hypothetical protein